MALDTELPPEVPLTEAAPPVERDYSALAEKLGVDLGVAPPADTPPVPGEPTKEVTPPVPSAEPTGKDYARKRVEEREWKQKYEALQAEYEPVKSKLPELESQLVETKTLAEQRAAKLKEIEEAYRNEAEAFNPDLINELPEVREAQSKFNSMAANLFPVDLSNPDNDEPDLRFDPAALTPDKSAVVRTMLDHWEKAEFSSEMSSARRAEIQHVSLSHIAAQIGVPSSAFDIKEIDGKEYPLLSTRHPVYKHLKASVRPFIAARQEVGAVQAAAAEKKQESLTSIVRTRADNTRKLFRDVGVGLTGEALQTALAKTPDNVNLKAMKLLEAHPDLVAELNANMEAEAALNGHFRPQLDLTDTDLSARNKAAQAHLTRIGQRAVNAPLAPVLKSLVLKQDAEIGALKEKIKALEEEASRTRIQAEPGAVGGGGESNTPPAEGEFGAYSKYAHLLK